MVKKKLGILAIKKMIKKKWQNLFYGKCPNCGEKMEESNGYLACPNAHPDNEAKNCFFIKTDAAITLLLNENHAANKYLTLGERERLEEAIQNLNNIA